MGDREGTTREGCLHGVVGILGRFQKQILDTGLSRQRQSARYGNSLGRREPEISAVALFSGAYLEQFGAVHFRCVRIQARRVPGVPLGQIPRGSLPSSSDRQVSWAIRYSPKSLVSKLPTRGCSWRRPLTSRYCAAATMRRAPQAILVEHAAGDYSLRCEWNSYFRRYLARHDRYVLGAGEVAIPFHRDEDLVLARWNSEMAGGIA